MQRGIFHCYNPAPKSIGAKQTQRSFSLNKRPKFDPGPARILYAK